MNFAALSFIVAFFIFGAYSDVSEKCHDCMPNNSLWRPICTVDSSKRYFATFRNREIYECDKACGIDINYVKDGHCDGDAPVVKNICSYCPRPLYGDRTARSYCVRMNGRLQSYANARAAYCDNICQPSSIKLLHKGSCQMEENYN